jgi:hypothetical protein
MANDSVRAALSLNIRRQQQTAELNNNPFVISTSELMGALAASGVFDDRKIDRDEALAMCEFSPYPGGIEMDPAFSVEAATVVETLLSQAGFQDLLTGPEWLGSYAERS